MPETEDDTRGFPENLPLLFPFLAAAVASSGNAAGTLPRPTRAQPRCAPIIPCVVGSGRFAVATRRGSATPHTGAAALRPYHYPLHCGAVVASPALAVVWRRARHAVSIPFIAGQWSLRFFAEAGRDEAFEFQSPSLRGSGRFGSGQTQPSSERSWFQSPSLRGSGRFGYRMGGVGVLVLVSIPFIAGQWSLLRRFAPSFARSWS